MTAQEDGAADVDAGEDTVAQGVRGYLPTLDAKGSYGYLESGTVSGTGWTAQLAVQRFTLRREPGRETRVQAYGVSA